MLMHRLRPHLNVWLKTLPELLLAGAVSVLIQGQATAADVTAGAYGTRAEALELADEIAGKYSLDNEWVRRMIAQATHLRQVPRLMLPPATGATARNWHNYRSRFIDPVRIRAGTRFWQRNRATLARAEAEFGVPPEIIVGIIGVETIYGRVMGNFRVLDTLTTLSLDFPSTHPRADARQAFFRDELGQFLSLHHSAGTSPLQPRGSYAGAMGMPQFMPSSWRHYAIDFDRDGQIDLWRNEADIIGSVANYFREHGWRPGMPTHYPVRLSAQADMSTLLAPDIVPSFSAQRMAELGAELNLAGQQHDGQLALIELKNGDPNAGGSRPTFVAGTDNFYVVTRYNQSSYYAMAVIELGLEVAASLEK